MSKLFDVPETKFSYLQNEYNKNTSLTGSCGNWNAAHKALDTKTDQEKTLGPHQVVA